jgi:ubiquinone/menaquinone biosynthesis C-methylase UbiE
MAGAGRGGLIVERNGVRVGGSRGIVAGMGSEFRGEVVEFYHRYRHGYPSAVIDALAEVFGLGARDVVVDLGCGTGQLTLALASRVGTVLGVDPEPDMLGRARQAAGEAGAGNVSWMLGGDTDLPALRGLLGDGSVAVVTIAQALHWMRHEEVFAASMPLVRPGGGVAVVTNGTPLWLADTDWSRALRGFLERRLGVTLSYACGTDEQSQQRYRDALAAAGFEVVTRAFDYTADLDLSQVVGGVYSAMSADHLPAADQRQAFTEELGRALGGDGRFSEAVHVAIVAGRLG